MWQVRLKQKDNEDCGRGWERKKKEKGEPIILAIKGKKNKRRKKEWRWE